MKDFLKLVRDQLLIKLDDRNVYSLEDINKASEVLKKCKKINQKNIDIELNKKRHFSHEFFSNKFDSELGGIPLIEGHLLEYIFMQEYERNEEAVKNLVNKLSFIDYKNEQKRPLEEVREII